MDVFDRLREHCVVAVLRAPGVEAALGGIAALVEGGVRALEVTYSTPGAASVIRQARQRHGDSVVVGAGTVTTPAQVEEAVQAGAEFLVSPGVREPVAEAMRQSGTPFALGALTPSEVMAAVDLGAAVVKLFPGSLGGPAYLRALQGPFPDVPFMPTGGVGAHNVADWLAAGAFCLGAGSDLVSSALLADGNQAEITRRAAAFRTAVSQARP